MKNTAPATTTTATPIITNISGLVLLLDFSASDSVEMVLPFLVT